MKKLLALAALSGLMASPAFAAKVTVEFVPAEGDTVSIVFNDADGTTLMGEHPGTYTLNAETRELCGTGHTGETVCITLDTLEQTPAVGFSTGYVTADGARGTATITAIEE